MALQAPVLAGTMLPPVDADGFEVERVFRGGMRQMADGSTVVDLVNGNPKRKFTLTWTLISAGQKAAVEQAFDAIKGGSAVFVSPEGVSCTVRRDPSAPTLKLKGQLAAGGVLRFSGSLTLVEE